MRFKESTKAAYPENPTDLYSITVSWV